MLIHSAEITGSVQFNNTDVSGITSVAGFASTGSNQFNGNQSISGSITSNGTITAQTLVVQTVTSSVEFVTGSTRNGSLSSNTHQFTGSVLMTGSLLVNGGALAVQDGTILYHNIRWFTPTSTVSTSGTTVTSVGTQFNSGMVGAKLTISGESRLITGFTSNTQVTVNSAYSQNYSGIAAGSWGVFSKSITFATADNITLDGGFEIRNSTNGSLITAVYDRIQIGLRLADAGNNVAFNTTGVAQAFQLANDKTLVWYSGSSAAYNALNTSVDTGLRKNSPGVLEIYDGNTADGALTNRRDLLVRNITGSNAAFSGLISNTGTLSGSYTTNNPSSSLIVLSGSITPSASLGGASAMYVNTVLSASANSDVLVGLDINPTFTNGAFTNVSNIALRVIGNIILPNNGSSIQLAPGGTGNSTEIIYFNGGRATIGFDSVTSGALLASSAARNITFAVGATNAGRFFATTGNFSLQNGGTFTDAGFKLDVSGSTRLNGNTTVTGSIDVSGSITSNGTITAQTLVVQTVTSSIEFVTGSTRNGSIAGNTHQFTGSVFMSGSVGIGTSSPTTLLHVNGTGRISSTLRLEGNMTVGSDTTQWQLSGVANGGAIWQKSNSAAGGSDDRYLRLGNVDNNGTPNYVMTIFNSNVGIGTTAPSQILDVRKATASGDTQFNFLNSQNSSAGNTSVTSTIYLGFCDDSAGVANANKIVSGKSGDYTSTPNASSFLAFHTTNANTSAERMRITSAGNLLLGATTSDSYSGYSVMQVGGTTNGIFQTFDGTIKTAVVSNSSGFGLVGTRTNHPLSLISNDTERMRITSAGYCYLGDGFANSNHRINRKIAQGGIILVVSGYDSVTNDTTYFYSCSGTSGNGAATAMMVTRNDSTNRSINAGGTVNASGADYAEYMTKSVNDAINKGDIVGVDINGKLTNIFADSISFVIKSTDPSYVGGDVWGNEEAIGKKPFKTTDQTEEEFTIVNEVFEAK